MARGEAVSVGSRPISGKMGLMEPTVTQTPERTEPRVRRRKSVRIVSTPGTCGGKPRIDGHRIKVEHIAVCYERMGMSPDEIVTSHPTITLAQVHAALAYYYDHKQEIDADIEEGERFVEELRRSPHRRSSRNSLRLGRPMARTIRFHLDECCDPAIAGGLRRRNIDVTTSQEAGLLEAEDEQQAAYGLAENRVVFTHDADFLRLQAAGVPHAGIVFRAKDTLSLGEIIRRLVLIWEIYEPEEMADRVEYL